MATVHELRSLAGDSPTIVDIRKNPDGFQIPGSLRYRGEELEHAANVPFAKEQRVVLYCGSGNSCARVAETLRKRGYANVEALEGGYAAWKDAGLPLESLTEIREIGGRT